MEAPITKKEKRRLKEARKKAEVKPTTGRKSSQKPTNSINLDDDDEPADRQKQSRSSKTQSRKRGQAMPLAEPTLDDAGVATLRDDIRTKGSKLIAKWDEAWQGMLTLEASLTQDLVLQLAPLLGDRPLHVICLGLGKPASDRTAQIQLALLLELASALKVCHVPLFTSSAHRIRPKRSKHTIHFGKRTIVKSSVQLEWLT